MGLKNPDLVDRLVGERIRVARKLQGISQTKLAATLGLSFQQVQKYEKGTNRIPPSRLTIVAEQLGKPVAWFFGGDRDVEPVAGADEIARMLAAPHGVALARAFLAIERNTDRLALTQIAQGLADKATKLGRAA